MKVAITAQGTELTSSVDPRFGRARWFIIADLDSNSIQAIDNAPNLNAIRGAGIQAAETVARHGVQAVLTGHCGPKAFRTLNAAGIKVYVGVEGAVKDALERFKANQLKPADSADVAGHWS